MKRKMISMLLCVVLLLVALNLMEPAGAVQELQPYVTTAATTAEEVLNAWQTGNYSCVKLGADLELILSGQNITIDLAGNNLAANGKGNVSAFDSANDTYDHLACGAMTAAEGVTCDAVYIAPNGNRYVALTDGSYSTFHRLEMKIKTVTLRTSSAGLYYKANYQCDRQIEEKVQSYGIVVSLQDVPGADFKSVEGDAYTVASEKFASGATVTSGSVVGIMKDDLTPAENLNRSRMPIYANAYIDLGNGPIMADNDNIGTKKGTSASLLQVVTALDQTYGSYSTVVQGQLDAFCKTWKNLGVNFETENINKYRTVDNSDLVFDAGTTNAWCPVCEKKVTWTAVSSNFTAKNGGHYYLAKDVTYAADNNQDFISAPGTPGHSACFHLNGHNLTTTKYRAICGDSGILNIMGNGTVAGYNMKSTHGAAIHVSNKNPNSQINLYGGTYKKVPNTPYTGSVIMINSGGGNLNVYEGVMIQADTNGKYAIRTMQNLYRNTDITLRGCTIKGRVELEEATYATNLEMIDCSVSGSVGFYAEHNVTMSGKMTIARLVVRGDAKATFKSLDPESSIAVTASGTFSNASSNIGMYVECFRSYESGNSVFVKNNSLYCGRDYAGDLKFAEGTTDAFCPACAKTVTWTEIVAGSSPITMVNGGHYYLAEDQNYTGGGTAFLSFSNKATVCVHLNGNNLTSNTRALYTGTGTTNIMGTGVITGKNYNETTYGAALHHNSRSGVINLYSGTYRSASDVADNIYVLNMHQVGGDLNIYEDAIVEAPVNGNAIRIGEASSGNIVVNITGATVKGDICMVGSKSYDAFAASLTIDGAKINGTVDVNGTNNFTLVHDAKVDMLDMEDTTKVTLDRLSDGADITVKNPGEFSVANEKAADYAKYFTAAWINDKILAQDNVLRYKVNYTADLRPNAAGEDYCPACDQVVKWEAFTDDSAAHTFTNGGHYYLTRDLVYEGTSAFLSTGAAGTTTCLHLNGHNITSTNVYTLFIAHGYMNVMGEGTVAGKTDNTSRGTAIFGNNKTATNGLSLYSGTYTKYDSASNVPVITIGSNGGNMAIFEDALVDAGSGMAIKTGVASNRDITFILQGTTVKGDVTIYSPSSTYAAMFEAVNTTISGTVRSYPNENVTFSGRTKIGKLTVEEGQIVNFENMLPGSSVKVSADGAFSGYMENADDWIEYFTTTDAGDWVIVRNKTFYQGVKNGLTAAEETDIQVLLASYGDRMVRYGETHNHSSSGPSGSADGLYSIDKWRQDMISLGMDFATIVDHRQSSHMYAEGWDNDQVTFIGGTETGTNLTDLPDGKNNMHMNLVFSDPAKLEALISSGHSQFLNVAEATDGWSGLTYKASGSLSLEQVRSLADLVYELGGFFVHVHPKYEGYIDSADPMDYYCGEYTGIEIMCATSSYSDSREGWNQETYDLWVDLLELGKKVYATYGNDDHKLPTTTSLTAIYTATKDADEYMEYTRNGDFTPGWVGVRMQVGDALMGGTTNFAGQRLVIAAGEMFAGKYNATHKYTIQLYDDGGLLLESELDPSQMNYYAMDADPEAKFYRIVIWDATIGAHVAVGNPIWNG